MTNNYENCYHCNSNHNMAYIMSIVAMNVPRNERWYTMFTEYEKAILKIVANWRNYDNLESELNDNACGVYLRDITEYTPLDAKTARGVLSSLIQKDMLYKDDVNGEIFFRATDECLEYCYNVLDKESEV